MESLGERIARLRKSKGLSQRKLMETLKFENLSKYEKDIRKPNYEILNSLATFFNVSTDYLLNGENINPEPIQNIITAAENINQDFELTEREQKLIESFRHLEDFDKDIVENTLKMLLDRTEKNPTSPSYVPGEELATVAELSEDYYYKKQA